MTDKCGIVLFHTTKKENLAGIFKTGIKPGEGKGWCEAVKSGTSITPLTEKDIKECQENIFLSGSLDNLETLPLKEEFGMDTILITCIPQDKIYINNKSFEQWYEERKIDDKLSRYDEIKVKDTIPPENIIGCLNIEEDTVVPNLGIYSINRKCNNHIR